MSVTAPATTGRPLLPEELAARLDEPPAEEMPDEVAGELATPRLVVSDAHDGSPLDLGSLLEDGGENLRLPRHAVLGRPGKSAERLYRAEVSVEDRADTEPRRVPWLPLVHQPRVAPAVASRPSMRRLNGRRTEPYYGVYPPDDRQVYYPSGYPWSCVGRIFAWTDASQPSWSWSGSGVLVGSRHVLTAGHVCPWGSSNWMMLFVPAYWDGASLFGAGARSYVSDYRGWNTNDTVTAHDMAVLRLYDPVGSSLGWMGTKVYDSSWEDGPYWTLTGYPGAIAGAERPSYQASIPVLDDDNDGDAKELEHHGDSTAGDSGGPFFGFWGSSPYAVGTTSGGESITGTPFGWWDEDNNIEAGGQAMVDLVLWAQANWP